MTQRHCTQKAGKIFQINEEEVKEHLGEIVRGTAQETLNALLEEEAERLCNAKRYERTESRRDTKAGYYKRKLQTRAGEVELRVPKLRALPYVLILHAKSRSVRLRLSSPAGYYNQERRIRRINR